MVGPFDEQFKIVGDFDWCIRAALISNNFVLSQKIAGVFRVDGKGLSAGGRIAHKVENNIVYLRHGILDKVVSVPHELMAPYNKEMIFSEGVSRPFKI